MLYIFTKDYMPSVYVDIVANSFSLMLLLLRTTLLTRCDHYSQTRSVLT